MVVVVAIVEDEGGYSPEISVTAEVQGVHGHKPPSTRLAERVRTWLEELGLRMETKRKLSFLLQIGEYRPRLSSAGVKAISLADFGKWTNVVELRVRLEGGGLLYRCDLVCPDSSVALRILDLARPEAALYRERHVSYDKADAEEILKKPNGLVQRRAAKLVGLLSSSDSLIKRLRSRGTLRELAYNLCQGESGPKDEISADQIHSTIIGTLKCQGFGKEVRWELLRFLVGIGFIEPKAGMSDSIFLPTALFADCFEDRVLALAEEQKELLAAQRAKLQRELQSAEGQFFRALNDCCTACRRKRGIEARLVEINQKLSGIKGGITT